MSILRPLAYFFSDPLVILWLLALCAAVYSYLHKKKWARIFLSLAAGWLFIITVSPLPQWLVRQLEKQYTVLRPEKLTPYHGIHILVLGGGQSFAPDLTYADQLGTSDLSRLTEGIRLYKQLPGSKMVTSGYSGSGRRSQAETVALAALDLGVSTADTLMLTQTKTTQDEAETYAKRFGTGQKFILVTDAVHMPRAMKWFHKAGLEPIPAPTNYKIKLDPDHWAYDFQLSQSKIGLMENVIHESIGMLLTVF